MNTQSEQAKELEKEKQFLKIIKEKDDQIKKLIETNANLTECINKLIETNKNLVESLCKEKKSLVKEEVNKPIELSNASVSAPIEETFRFKWISGLNMSLTNNSKKVSKISGNGKWNCTVLGNKTLIKNKINKWKIKLNKLGLYKNIMIGITRKSTDPKGNSNYQKSWCFYCCDYRDGRHKFIENVSTFYTYESLKEGDILEVVFDTTKEKGKLSFSLNGKDLGVATEDINLNEELVPFAEIAEQGSVIELVN